MSKYKIVSNHPELERETKFIIESQELRPGKLYLFEINSLLIVGRWLPGWILQPERWIKISHTAVKVLGHVVHLIL